MLAAAMAMAEAAVLSGAARPLSDRLATNWVAVDCLL